MLVVQSRQLLRYKSHLEVLQYLLFEEFLRYLGEFGKTTIDSLFYVS
jgi:hypothetical protein